MLFSFGLTKEGTELGSDWESYINRTLVMKKECYWDTSITLSTNGSNSLADAVSKMLEPVFELKSNLMINLNRTLDNGRDRDARNLKFELILEKHLERLREHDVKNIV